jgi:hypothetical protein
LAAAGVGMRGLGQPPEGGVDLRRLEGAAKGWNVILPLVSPSTAAMVC